MKVTREGAILILETLIPSLLVELHVNIQSNGEGGLIRGGEALTVLDWLKEKAQSTITEDVLIEFPIMVWWEDDIQNETKESEYSSYEIILAFRHYCKLERNPRTSNVRCNVDFTHENLKYNRNLISNQN